MSSSKHVQHFTPQNIQTLRRVLDTAGVFDVATAWHTERRMRFGRFLISKFQMGMTSESDLTDSLISKIAVLHSSCIPKRRVLHRKLDLARWENEGGKVALSRTKGSQPTCGLIERSGFGSVYHTLASPSNSCGMRETQAPSKPVSDIVLKIINVSGTGKHHDQL